MVSLASHAPNTIRVTRWSLWAGALPSQCFASVAIADSRALGTAAFVLMYESSPVTAVEPERSVAFDQAYIQSLMGDLRRSHV